MWILTNIANWWDEQRGQSELILEQFVENNPNQFGFVVATAMHTSIELGAGVVDVLRLGDGIVQGSIKGIATDGLRLLAIAGPVGKLTHVLKSAQNAKIARAILNPPGQICSWVAATKALVQTGQKINGKMFVAVEDLARAVGVPWSKLGGIKLEDMARNLRNIGANVGPLKYVKGMPDIISMLPRDGSVVLVSFQLLKNGKEFNHHAMYVFYDHLGRLRIMDRTMIHDSLEIIAKIHRVDQMIPRAAVQVNNVYAKLLDLRGTAILAIEALGVVATERK